MSWTLDQGLAEISCGGLLVLAESASDPDLAQFVGSAHIGDCFLIYGEPTDVSPTGANSDAAVRPGELPETCWLGYLTAMERDEAASTGLRLLDPKALGVEKARRRHGSSAAFWEEVIGRGLELAGLEPTVMALGGRTALGTSHLALSRLAARGWQFEDGRSLLLRHRKRKTSGQIEQVRRSASGVCAAFRCAAEVLASVEPENAALSWEGEPLTASVLRREISLALAGFGLSQPRDNIVAAGSDAAVPHSQGADERVLRAHETIVIDLFPKGELFADCTRTFCVGEPPPDVGSAFGVVREALERAYAEAHPGMRLWELQEKTCGLFADRGYPTPITNPGTTSGYVHGLGHGVGFEIHEYPSFAQDASEEGVLEAGDVFTLEPGLYDQAAGYGIRLEDLCLATDEGIENLTPLPYDLDPRSW